MSICNVLHLVHCCHTFLLFQVTVYLLPAKGVGVESSVVGILEICCHRYYNNFCTNTNTRV